MTKRTLLIIIGLLVLLDSAAFFVYLIGNSNSDGKSPIENVFRDSVATVADTIPSTFIEDKFDTITRNESFLSLDKMKVGNEFKSMKCMMKIKLIWPVAVNNNNDLSSLHRELLSRITSTSSDDVKEALDQLFEKPEFAHESTRFVATGDDSDFAPEINKTMQQYRIFPYISTNYLLEMVVLAEKHNGSSLSRYMNIVHYDRVHHNVISIDKIFDLSKSDDILALVNQRIEAEKMSGTHDNWHETNILPTEFLLGRKSVVFYLPDGSIAPRGTGLHEISVSNEDLEPYFTSYYSELLANDTNFVTYDFITL